MTKFDFFSVPRILFGPGQRAQLPALAATLGTRALLVHSLPDPQLAEISAQLSAKIPLTPFRQKGEPTTTHVDRALAAARDNNCDCVLAIGGGSAIDCAKAVAGLLTNGGTALDYMEVVGKGQKITRPAAPWIALPTTAGTGAEATRNAVIGYPEKNFKASIRSELLLPRIALIDPELAIHVPAHVTASSGMDALCQCIEAYTSTGATPMTDALALEGITRAARSLQRAYEHPTDLAAREDMALAALLSGIALTNAGLGAVHGFAAPLGAAFPIPHGTICAALLPHVIAANVAAMRATNHPALHRYVHIARAIAPNNSAHAIVPNHTAARAIVPNNSPAHAITPNNSAAVAASDSSPRQGPTGPQSWVPSPVCSGEAPAGALEALDPDTPIAALTHFTHSLAQSLNIPRLSTFGITPAHIPAIVELAQKASSMKFNPIQLPPATLTQILQSAL